MMFAVLFEDNEDKAEMRGRHMADHLAFLERSSGTIKATGPLTDGATDEAAGGLWLIDAPDHQAVRDLVEADPFWPTGLRRSVRVLRWKQVFRDGQRLI
jgi:uncharacterized protein YciI